MSDKHTPLFNARYEANGKSITYPQNSEHSLAQCITPEFAQSLVLAANHIDEAVGLLEEAMLDGFERYDDTWEKIQSLLERIKNTRGPEQDEWVVAMLKNSKLKEAKHGSQ